MRLAVLGAALVAAGAVAALLVHLPSSALATLAGRAVPVLGFVVAASIVAGLASEAGLFQLLGNGAARLAGGSAWRLWALVVALATASTVFLSLDTTAVLLTPVVVLAARRAGLPATPFAMTTVQLANCGSLLLPVSNLTNLLAQQRIGGQADYVRLSAVPAAVAVLVPVALLAVVHRRALAQRFTLPAREPVQDRPLLVVAAVVVGLLVPALVSGVPVVVPAAVAAVVLVAVFAVRRPRALRPGLVPVGLVLFAAGLLLLVDVLGRAGLQAALHAVAGGGEDLVALLRVAAVGLLGANLADNLPAYLALEPVAGAPRRLMALLVAVDAGPLITPWASLATLLWAGRLAALGEPVRWRRVVLQGALTAVTATAAATAALALAD